MKLLAKKGLRGRVWVYGANPRLIRLSIGPLAFELVLDKAEAIDLAKQLVACIDEMEAGCPPSPPA